jgi:hypothetical protein
MVIQSTQALGRPRPGGARCPVLLGGSSHQSNATPRWSAALGCAIRIGLVNRSRDRGLLLKVEVEAGGSGNEEGRSTRQRTAEAQSLALPSLPFDSGLHPQGLQMHAHPVPAYVCQHEAARRVAVGGARRGLSSAIDQNVIARAQRHLPLSSNCRASR